MDTKYIRNLSIIAHIDHSKSTLAEQPNGNRTIAVNKAGEGEPSNTEMVVL